MRETIQENVLPLNSGTRPLDRSGSDRYLLAAVICLLLFGVLMVYSSTSVVAPDGKTEAAPGDTTQFLYLRKHLLSMIVGGMFMVLAFRIDLMRLRAFSSLLLVLAAVMTVSVFIPGLGLTVNGARRWIRFWPSTIQPSEFAKLAMVIFLARYLSSPGYRPDRFMDYVKPLVVMALFQGLFLLQPDFGAAITLGLITFTMLFLSGTRKRFIAYTALLLVPAIVKLIMVPYRLKRVLSFMDPWSDQQGAGYQLVQSLIALGSGGMTGIGIGESKQKLAFLPYINTDFIFSFLGEELGLAGVSLVLLLYGMIFYCGMRIGTRYPGTFHSCLAQGLTYFIIYQMLINVAVVTGLAPTKGLPLPFVSYGGSSLLANMAAVGLLLSLSRGYCAVTGECDHAEEFIKRKKARIAVYGRGVQQVRLP
ncbi:MAG: putative lipid II flippase FtsW [bacterium]